MRNWNRFLVAFILAVYGSFEPTYEELKPFKSYARRLDIASFEPTYEELKLVPETSEPSNIRCFEPTYEELKPFKSYARRLDIATFWAYLWGIETSGKITGKNIKDIGFEPTYEELKQFQVYVHFGIPDYVLSLPMRNWNM